MKLPADPILRTQARITRVRKRVAKWEREAGTVEASWTGGPDYTRFCQGMAKAAGEKKAQLEAKLRQLTAGQADIDRAAIGRDKAWLQGRQPEPAAGPFPEGSA